MKVRALVVSVLAFLPASLLAQETSTPFRAGQWAAQFTGGASFASVGVLKFRSPTRALILDVQVFGSHFENFLNDSLEAVHSNAAIELRLGRRSYRQIADNVVAQHSLGIQGGLSHLVITQPSSGRSTQNGWDVGPFAELGALYLVTPKFGIGATGTAVIHYQHASSEPSGGTKSYSWAISAGANISFTATLFF